MGEVASLGLLEQNRWRPGVAGMGTQEMTGKLALKSHHFE